MVQNAATYEVPLIPVKLGLLVGGPACESDGHWCFTVHPIVRVRASVDVSLDDRP
jgi:hypothetical protein